MIIRTFQVLAAMLAAIAAYFLWQENTDAAFFIGVLAASSFFLSIRFQVKERLRQRDEESDSESIP